MLYNEVSVVHDFFQTKAAYLIRDQIKISQEFYSGLIALIERHGQEKEALTMFDLEDMIADLPGASSEFAVAVSVLASNNGKEYVSAHELRIRAKEQATRLFKLGYAGYMFATKKVKYTEFKAGERQPDIEL